MANSAFSAAQPQVSTWQLPDSDKRAFWLDHIDRHLIQVDCTSPTTSAINASLVHRDVEQARLNLISATPHAVQRSQSNISADRRHSIFACFMIEGFGFTWQGNRCAQHGPGDIVLYDTQQPYGHGFSTDMSMLVMDLPEPVARRYLGQWQRENVLHLRNDIRYTDTSSAAVHQLVQQGLQSSLENPARTDMHSILEQLQALLLNYLDGESGHALWQRCQHYIQRHLAEDTLNAEQLASCLFISERQLSRLFAQQGTSVQRYIWQQRLVRCREDITNPNMNNWSISDIAFHWGFNHSAHFSRRYREKFGESPTETRHRTQDPASGQSG
jgi:AraC-like DNA-binding protein